MTTRQQILDLLRTNDLAVARALVALNDRQTEDEQAAEHTRYLNGRGFRPCHARMGTSMAKFFAARGYLTEKQVAYWRRPMKDGRSRIEIYAGQLLEVAEARAAKKVGSYAQAAAQANGLRREAGEFEPERELVDREMQEMEAAGDLAQTRIDEHNKFLARCRMERG